MKDTITANYQLLGAQFSLDLTEVNFSARDERNTFSWFGVSKRPIGHCDDPIFSCQILQAQNIPISRMADNFRQDRREIKIPSNHDVVREKLPAYRERYDGAPDPDTEWNLEFVSARPTLSCRTPGSSC